MLSVKTPLLLIATIVLALLGFAASHLWILPEASLLPQLMFSLGVVITSALFMFLSSLTTSASSPKSAATPSRAPTKASKPSVSAGDSELATLYVGNLPYKANEAIVKELFEKYGQVQSVRLMKDKRTGKRKGFGFVEVANAGADAMISKLNDSEFMERTLKVRPAKDKVE